MNRGAIMVFLLVWGLLASGWFRLAASIDLKVTYQHSPLRIYFQNPEAFGRAFGYEAKTGQFGQYLYIEATFEDGKRLLYDPRQAYEPKKPDERHWIEPR
jgi:hypothetical protein